MTTLLHQLYLDTTFKLAESLLLHSEYEAAGVEETLAFNEQRLVSEDKTTWLYYQDLNGDYHYSRTPMTIVSLDTLEVIPFTKASLVSNKTTAEKYTYDSEHVADLVKRYPDQSRLIHGIIRPIDYAVSTNSPEGKILGYDDTLVESNEQSLIAELQSRFYKFFKRYKTEYAQIEPNYVSAVYARLAELVVPWILTLRIHRCKTSEVHSFHIRSHLASHSHLDRYINVLNKDQQFYLYKNIQHIENHVGRSDTFDELVEVLLTNRSIPLSRYKMTHNLDKLPGKLLPEIEMVNEPYNYSERQGARSIKTLDKLVSLERHLATGNDSVEADYLDNFKENIIRHRRSNYPTRVFESNVIVPSGLSPWTLEQQLLSYWALMAVNGNYKSILNLETVATNNKVFLDPLAALILYIYCLSKGNGWDLTYVPIFNAKQLLKSPLPSFDTLRSKSHLAVSDDDIALALSAIPSIHEEYVSPVAFHTGVKAIHSRLVNHYIQYSREEHYKHHIYQKLMVLSLYQTEKRIRLTPSKITYVQWLSDLEFDFDNFTPEDYLQFATHIYRTATHTTDEELTVKDVQLGSVRLLKQLSHYGVQIITDDNRDPLATNGHSSFRLGDIDRRLNSVIYQNGLDLDITHQQSLKSVVRSPQRPMASFIKRTVSHTTATAGVPSASLATSRQSALTAMLPTYRLK